MGINILPILQLHDLPNKVDSLIKYMFPEQQRGDVSSFNVNTYTSRTNTVESSTKQLQCNINNIHKLHVYELYSTPKDDLFTR